MKRLNIYHIIMTAFVVLLLSTSCTKWLDITPSDTISQDKLYSGTEGCRVALNGVYKLASSENLYGRELTWGLISACGQNYTFGPYDNSGISGYHPWTTIAYDYNYEDSKSIELFAKIWESGFKCVANCNNLLKQLTKFEETDFENGKLEYDLIKGEALAMRAMMHFDMLRLYAPAPTSGDSEVYVPYYDQLGLSTGSLHLSVTEVLEKAIVDLKSAQLLVKPFDVGVEENCKVLNQKFRYGMPGWASSDSDDIFLNDAFFTCRGYRMNYAAITAILARVYNYKGEHKLAFDEVEKVLGLSCDFYDDGSTEKVFNFSTADDLDKEKKSFKDIIFTLSDKQLYNNYSSYSMPNNYCFLNISQDFTQYGTLFDDADDVRNNKQISRYGGNLLPLKFARPAAITEESSISEDMLPVIRLSELYYIKAEYYASENNFTSAAAMLDKVRGFRGCTLGNLNIYDIDSFNTELINEANREFISEGQSYYYYKKLGIMPGYMYDESSFVFPKPVSENI